MKKHLAWIKQAQADGHPAGCQCRRCGAARRAVRKAADKGSKKARSLVLSGSV